MPPVNGRHFAFILIVKQSETVKNIITAKLETSLGGPWEENYPLSIIILLPLLSLPSSALVFSSSIPGLF